MEKVVVPVHKKDNKQTIENYHPVSLLHICGNILNTCFIALCFL